MRKLKTIAAIFCCFIFISTISAQDAGMFMSEGTYCTIYSEISKTQAEESSATVDALIPFFNNYFHFDLASLAHPLKIKILEDQTAFTEYLTKHDYEPKGSFVFIQYSDPARNELVGYYTTPDTFSESLVQNSFIHYLKAFIPHPPLWMLQGFAIYFEKCEYNSETASVTYRENLAWLESIKTYVANVGTSTDPSELPYTLQNFLFIDLETAQSQPEIFHAQSWSLVNFLMNSKMVYNRVLWDSINALSPEATKRENELSIKEKAFDWVNENVMTNDFFAYLQDLKTFPNLIEDGMAAYSSADYDTAETEFLAAVELDKTHYLPYYYLGLINYANAEYSMAEFYYHSSIQMGGDNGLNYYALGVNAYADNRLEDADFYLNQSLTIDPEGYGVKARELLTRIESESTQE